MGRKELHENRTGGAGGGGRGREGKIHSELGKRRKGDDPIGLKERVNQPPPKPSEGAQEPCRGERGHIEEGASRARGKENKQGSRSELQNKEHMYILANVATVATTPLRVGNKEVSHCV